jgi:branched-chain amino acid transport system ATP-binding protein
MTSAPMLVVKDLHAWYGESHVLHGVEFVVNQGEVVTLLGRNGVGKTTTLKSIMGMAGRRAGSIAFEGKETIGLSSDRIARLGKIGSWQQLLMFSVSIHKRV